MEREFSALNQILTDECNRMSTLTSLIFTAINGPDERPFPAQKFVEIWIQEGQNAADDKPAGKPKKAT